MNNTVEVSIVIPTFNSAETLYECLLSIVANTTIYKYEIIVCDAGSTDNTLKIAESMADLVLTGEPGHINRNIGIRAAKGDIILFTDSDCRVPVDWIDGLVTALLDKNCDTIGVGGGNIPWLRENSESIEKAISIVMHSPLVAFRSRNTTNYKTLKHVDHNPPVNSAYYKHALLSIGLFDETPGYPEDLDLDYRLKKAGYTLCYTPNVKVQHRHKSTIKAFAHQMLDFGRKRIRINKKYRDIRRWWHQGPALLVAFMINPLLFFIPLLMALVNALITRGASKWRIFGLTLVFYWSYGLGEWEAM